MKVYLSARYGRMTELSVYAAELKAAGHECTSRWLNGSTFEATAANAEIDEADVASSDVVVGFMDRPVEHSPFPYAARGGRHYEIGFARGLGIPCIMVGDEPENVFHYERPGMIVAQTWSMVLAYIDAIEFEAARAFWETHAMIKHEGLKAVISNVRAWARRMIDRLRGAA